MLLDDDDGGVGSTDVFIFLGKIDDICTYVPCTSEQAEDGLSSSEGTVYGPGGVDLSSGGGISSPRHSISSRISRMRSDVGVITDGTGVGTSYISSARDGPGRGVGGRGAGGRDGPAYTSGSVGPIGASGSL